MPVVPDLNRPAEAIERFAGDEYRQHNPHVGDGKQAFIDHGRRLSGRPLAS